MANRKPSANPPAKSTKSLRATVAFAEARGDAPPKEKKEKKDKEAELMPPDKAAEAEEAIAATAPADAVEPPAAAVPAVAATETVTDLAPPAPEPAPPAPAPAAPALELTELPAPDAIVRSDPRAPAPPPGHVPPGDSRSLRRRRGDTDEFALIYRHESHLILRTGEVGTAGEWRDTEYPTIAAAAHAYALETSRLVGEGFYDYR